MNRRGFLATLAGALLAHKVGPFQIETGPEVWKAAPALPLYPITNQYIPLQVFAAEAVKSISRELKWLRLKNHRVPNYYADRAYRLGDTVQLRKPYVFTINEDITDVQAIVERYVPVSMTHTVGVHIPFEMEEIRGRPLPEFCKRHLEVASALMAENIIRHVRAAGGADHLVTADLTLDIPQVPRAALVLGEAEDLSIRAIHMPRYLDVTGRFEGREVIRLDMLFGLGDEG
jgi:hypothetical protein